MSHDSCPTTERRRCTARKNVARRNWRHKQNVMYEEFDAEFFAAAQAGRSGEITSLLQAARCAPILRTKLRVILGKLLRVAAANNHLKAVQALLAWGRYQVQQSLIEYSTDMSPVDVAARYGHADILQLLLKQCQPNSFCSRGMFTEAICGGRCDDVSFARVTRVLIQYNADVTYPLGTAAAYGTKAMVLTLLKAKASAASEAVGAAVHTALAYNRNACDIMAALVRHKGDVDKLYCPEQWCDPSQAGLTPLCRASGNPAPLFQALFLGRTNLQSHQLRCIATLLRLKADIHGGAKLPVLAAAEHSGPAVVQALLSAKSNVQIGLKSALAALFGGGGGVGSGGGARTTIAHGDNLRHPPMPTALLLIRAKAQVDDYILRRACGWCVSAEQCADAVDLLRVLYRAHPVPAQAQKVVLASDMFPQLLAELLKSELGGDVSGVSTAASPLRLHH